MNDSAYFRITPSHLPLSSRFAIAALLASLCLLIAGCGHNEVFQPAATPKTGELKMEGVAFGGQQPVTGATIQLYAVGGTGDQSAATPLITGPAVLSGAGGHFSITGLYTCPNAATEVFLVASGGNPGLGEGTNNAALVMMSALGPCGNLSATTFVSVNEVSTVGSIYPLVAFMGSYLNVGSSVANAGTLASDFGLVNQFINTANGQAPGPALPSGYGLSVPKLYSLANSIAACINSPGGVAGDGTVCGNLFLYAKPPSAPAPTNTADAILDIANNPLQNVTQIFNLAAPVAVFQPILAGPPVDWKLQILPTTSLTTLSSLVGVGSTDTGTITLGQPAPAGGVTVTFSTSNSSFVTATQNVTIPAGQSTASFSYTGVAIGTATITASAPGYLSSDVTLTATSSLISLGSVPVVGPGQSADIPLSIGVAAPVGGVTINFTSDAPGTATITPASVTIAAGLKVPSANPKINGIAAGATQIHASALGYAPGTRNVTVTVSANLPVTASVPLGIPGSVTLTLSSPAPVGGIAFSLLSDDTSIFTVPSTVIVLAGATTASVTVNGVSKGTTTLHAKSPNIIEATSSITVSGSINTGASSIVVGKFLESSATFNLGATPPAPVTATVTSSNPAVAIVSASISAPGGASIIVPSITSVGTNFYYVQGVSVGTTKITISAAGYADATVNVTVDPSGFVFTQTSLTTAAFSSDSAINIQPVVLDPITLAVLNGSTIAPSGGANIAIANTTPATGTITNSPIAFAAGDASKSATFHPLAAGSTTLTLTTPAGFSTPSSAATQQVSVTVTAPSINATSLSTVTGKGLEIQQNVNLSQTPQAATAVTVTSNNPAVAVLSLNATTVGSTSVTFPNVVSSGAQTYFIQGVTLGSTTLTVSAPGYANLTLNVTVSPSGFQIYAPGSITTTTFSSPTVITLQPVILNPVNSTVVGSALLSPFSGTVNVALTSGTPTVGTIVASPITFHGGDATATGSFQPVTAGTSLLSIDTPAGFNTPAPLGSQQLTATVSAPPLSTGSSNIVTGVKLETGTSISLSQSPPAPVTLTITSNNSAIATVSSSATTLGAGTLTFPNVVNPAAKAYYVQGQGIGSTTLTITAPGFQTLTVNVTVDPSGFIIFAPGSITTTTFSSPTAVSIQPVYLNPATSAVLGSATFAPGNGTVSIAVTSSAIQVGTITTPLTFSAGDATAVANFQPVAAGSTNISIASPAGFSTPTASQQIAATISSPSINLGSPTVGTGVNFEVGTYVTLSTAPPSPVAVTVTSNNPATVVLSTSASVAGSSSITFPSVSNTGTLAFQVQGLALGSTTLTVSAAGYANATINVTVTPSGFVITSTGTISTTTFSSATAITIAPAVLSSGTLTVLGYAALNPGAASPSITLSNSVPSVGSVTNAAALTGGATSTTASFQPAGAGSTLLTLIAPAGYSTPSLLSSQQVTANVTAPSINVGLSNIVTGHNLQVTTSANLSVAPPAAVTVSVTSNDPTVALVSTSGSISGSTTITYPGVSGPTSLLFSIQGQAVGSTTLTISAPGFKTSTVNVTVDPSGFVIYTPSSVTTTTFASATTVTVFPAILSPGILTVLGYGALNPGISASVAMSSSNTAVGTVTSPLLFNGSDSQKTSSFQPAGAGTATLSISTPSGYPTPASAQQITATVNAPPVSSASGNYVTGANLEISASTSLSTTPPAAVTLTVTSVDPTVAIISKSPTAAGAASVSFASVNTTAQQLYYIQGLKVGTTSLTLSAPGFATASITVTVDPSGFVIYTPQNFFTAVGSADKDIAIQPVILNPGVLTVNGYATLNPGIGTVNVAIASSNTAAGTVAPASVGFTGYQGASYAAFHAVANGATNITITQPAGFSTPSQTATQQIVATVQ